MNKRTRKLVINIFFILVISFIAWVIQYKSNNQYYNKTKQELTKHESSGVSAELFQIVNVVDGDTLDIKINNSVERVRLIGINTPEVVDPRKPVECFGAEASNRAKELLNGKKVRIENDPTQYDRDKYGRMLRYIYIEDGTFFNKTMIEQGYAYEYTYDIPYKYQADFKKAQEEAVNAKKGLWADGQCINK